MIGIIAAPSNLGLRPPEPGAVPGCAKAPEALREAGLHSRLRDARDYGVVLPGRYRDDWVAGERRLRNQDAIVEHARRLAARTTTVLDDGHTPLVLGGDCSLLIGAGLALRRRGRYGLVHLDGHTDFRNPWNSDQCASLAGEDLAAAVGRHWDAIADLDGLRPYFDPAHTIHAGHRPDDEERDEVAALLHAVIPASEARTAGPVIRALVEHHRLDGYWLHVDVDVLDPSVMPAVDSPDPGGLTAAELTDLLRDLGPGAIGTQFTVFDPDLDPTGDHARTLTDIIATAFA
jgi:arginase